MEKKRDFRAFLRDLKIKVENCIVNLLLLAALIWIGYGVYLLITKYVVIPLSSLP